MNNDIGPLQAKLDQSNSTISSLQSEVEGLIAKNGELARRIDQLQSDEKNIPIMQQVCTGSALYAR